MNVTEAMQYVQQFSKSGAVVHDLSRIESLLSELGNPHEKLRFVHIAGTNGKGSTLALASAAVIAAGYRVGQFTSPYMIRYNDRIRINGEDIPDETLAELCTRVSECQVSALCSQFEITFAIALLYFVAEQCDIVFLETGLGGLLDATNIISSPEAAVITSVSLDHMALLGNTVIEIAKQKLGIIKDNCPAVISADNPDEVKAMAKTAAAQHSAPLVIPDSDDCEILEKDLLHTVFAYQGHTVTLNMAGSHQVANAMTALAILDILNEKGFCITEEHLTAAMAEVQVPARIQVYEKEPLILLDGSHNESGVSALVNLLEDCAAGVPVIGICGMLLTKDYRTASRILSKRLSRVICIDDFTHGTVPKSDLCRCFADGCETDTADSPREALAKAKAYAEKHHAIVAVTGSLYLASCFLNMETGQDACL